MKGYRFERRPAGAVFVCDKCDFTVELEKFGIGTRARARTLGATAINKHIAQAHPKIDHKPSNFGIK